ncbi:hypothetical protein [Mycetocola zhujimingii]|uniref:DUF3592 domain-containing protein n=1 Tax=Mycetocola zhujimingii TaxID=2079792 RepID=A0A2U1TGV9_9MICO|nr:hypothetical protein [Mycetocola zhujimingii]PWC08106.1 hypothetical protein DF223_01760 [Mycetocola zhujimingii]
MRDVLTVATVALVVGCIAAIGLGGQAEFRHAAELVETQPREPSTFVELVPGGRRLSDRYYVDFRGEETEVDYGVLIRDPHPGLMVDVVQDPENPSHIIVAGTPDDWTETPDGPILMWGFGVLGGLVTASIAGLKFVPERTEPLLIKLIDALGGLMRWLTRFRRRPD